MKVYINIEETNNFCIIITIKRYANEEYVFASTFSVYRNGNVNDAYTVLNNIYETLDDMINDNDTIKVELETTCIVATKIFDLINRYIKRGKK